MLRTTLIWLSRQERIEAALSSSPLVRPLVRRFVAGDTHREALLSPLICALAAVPPRWRCWVKMSSIRWKLAPLRRPIWR